MAEKGLEPRLFLSSTLDRPAARAHFQGDDAQVGGWDAGVTVTVYRSEIPSKSGRVESLPAVYVQIGMRVSTCTRTCWDTRWRRWCFKAVTRPPEHALVLGKQKRSSLTQTLRAECSQLRSLSEARFPRAPQAGRRPRPSGTAWTRFREDAGLPGCCDRAGEGRPGGVDLGVRVSKMGRGERSGRGGRGGVTGRNLSHQEREGSPCEGEAESRPDPGLQEASRTRPPGSPWSPGL